MIVFSYFIEFSVVDKVSHYLATAKTDVEIVTGNIVG